MGVGLNLDFSPEEALLFTEIGRHLGQIPALGAVPGARVAARTGGEELAQAILAGDARVAVAVVENPGIDFHRSISGRFRVLGARQCDHVLFVGRSSGALLALGPGIEVVTAACIDASVSLGCVEPAMASLAIEAADLNCRTNIQVHGAMGGTDEHDAHVLLKRSHLLGSLFGNLHMHLADTLAASQGED